MADTAHGAPAAGDDHSAHGTHDAHADGHAQESLGPIDWRASLAAIVGVGAGLLVVAAMLLRPAG